LRAWGLRVEGSECRVWGYGYGSRGKDLGVRARGGGFRVFCVQGLLELKVQSLGLGYRASYLGFRFSSSG
jgi:hypothetical protein